LNRELCQVEKKLGKKRGPENFPVPSWKSGQEFKPVKRGWIYFFGTMGRST